jgi:hypothetical protein
MSLEWWITQSAIAQLAITIGVFYGLYLLFRSIFSGDFT